jgi:hypothetical protein
MSMTIISVGNEGPYFEQCSERTVIAKSPTGICANKCKQVLYPLPPVLKFDSCATTG